MPEVASEAAWPSTRPMPAMRSVALRASAKTSSDAALRQQHGAVLGGIQTERNRQDVGLGARALDDAVDDVEGVRGEARA